MHLQEEFVQLPGCSEMSPEFYRRFAQQCRELLGLARTEAAREQLLIWIHEFDTYAETAERTAQEKQQTTERDT
jgi:hypothetical protein